jgi:hypothetical protein
MVKSIKRKNRKNKSKRRGGKLSSITSLIENVREAYTSNEERAKRAEKLKKNMETSMAELNRGFKRVKTVGTNSGSPQEQLTQMFSLVGKTLQNKIK